MSNVNLPVEEKQRSDILKQLSRRPPRNGGFSRLGALVNWAEFSDERNFEGIRQYLLEDSPTARGDTSKPASRKYFLEGLFSSRSDRRSSKQSRKMLHTQSSSQEERKLPVVAQRTSFGGRYGQIITSQVYDGDRNASTYKVNIGRGASDASAGKESRQSIEPTKDRVNTAAVKKSSFKKATGLIQHVDGGSIQTANGDEPPASIPSPYQKIGLQKPTSGSSATRLVDYRRPNKDVPPGQTTSQVPKPLIDVPLQAVHHANDSFVVSRKEYPHLLLRDDKKSYTPRASQTSLPKTQSQPTIRDFAPGRSAPVQRAKAIRLRSRSPVKRVSKQKSAASSVIDIPEFPTHNGQALDFEASAPRSTAPVSHDLKARSYGPPPLSPTVSPIFTAGKPIPSLQPSPVTDSPSKNPSIMSAESTPSDIHSETSSVVVSNAQTATRMRNQGSTHAYHRTSTPPQPGPAPTKALPSLPEGQSPLTPARLSESSQRMPANPDRTSPVSLIKVPPRSPARYRLTPTDKGSPPNRDAVVEVEQASKSSATIPEHIRTSPLSPVQSKGKRRAVTLPESDGLPKSVTNGTLNDRTEKTKARKARDLARMQNQKADVERLDIAAMRADLDAANEYDNADGERHIKHEGLVLLPSPPDLTNSSSAPCPTTGHHESQLRRLSTSTTLQRDSSTLSRRLSPIIVIAEQEPKSPIPTQQEPFAQSRRNTAGYRRASISRSTNGLQPIPPKPLSPTLHFPDSDEGSKTRPLSAHSMPPPTSNNHPIVNRVPTPFALRGQLPSNRSSVQESVHDVPL